MEMAHDKQQTAIRHNLLTIPAELRLRIYEYLLPLDTPCGDLRGIVMSCRLVKEEMYYEMKKCVDGMQTMLEQRWPFDEAFQIVFPGRLFKAKDVIIDVPYIRENHVFLSDASTEAWNLFNKRKGLSLRVVRMTLRIGHIPGNPELSVQQKNRTLRTYLRLLSWKYCWIAGTTGSRRDIAQEREVRYKDG